GGPGQAVQGAAGLPEATRGSPERLAGRPDRHRRGPEAPDRAGGSLLPVPGRLSAKEPAGDESAGTCGGLPVLSPGPSAEARGKGGADRDRPRPDRRAPRRALDRTEPAGRPELAVEARQERGGTLSAQRFGPGNTRNTVRT